MIPAEADSVGIMMTVITRMGTAYISRRLEQYGVRGGSHAFLLAVVDNPGINQDALSGHFRLHKANVTRGIASLIEKGLVIREQDTDDRRAYRLFATEKGKSLAPRFREVLQEWDDQVLAGLTSDNQRHLKAMLGTLVQASQQVLEESTEDPQAGSFDALPGE